MLVSDIIQNFNALIKERKLSKVEIAEKLGVSTVTIRSYLEEKTQIPLDVFLCFCEVLKIEISIKQERPIDRAFELLKKELINAVKQKVIDDLGK